MYNLYSFDWSFLKVNNPKKIITPARVEAGKAIKKLYKTFEIS